MRPLWDSNTSPVKALSLSALLWICIFLCFFGLFMKIAWLSLLMTIPTLALAGLLGYGICLMGDLRAGMRRFSAGNYARALLYFQKSFETFSVKRWLNDRMWVVGVSLFMSPRETSLVNIAACHFHHDDREATLAAYDRIRQEYPENQFALKFFKTLSLAQPGPSPQP